MGKPAYFLDFEFKTEGMTFFPRPETEILVERAVSALSERKGREYRYDVLEIGTGCGNIAISLTKHLPSSRIIASDISESALWAASCNASFYGVSGRVDFIRRDLFRGMPDAYIGYFDLVISNPPYVSLADFPTLPGEVRDDPYSALYGGEDGLKFYREIAKDAPLFLKKEGLLMMEIGYGQSAAVRGMLALNGAFKDIEIYKDYNGIDRIIKACSVQKPELRSQMSDF